MVIEDLKKIGPDTEVWIVQMALMYFFQGAETSLGNLGDRDHSQFQHFAGNGYLDIKRADDIRNKHGAISTAPDFRGLICCIMDDFGFREPQQRHRILKALTGFGRMVDEGGYDND